MHMADALLAPGVAAAMFAATAVTTGLCVKRLKRDDDPKKLPMMAVTSALVFAGQMVNYTIPGTGSSGHISGAMLLTALLGPQAGFLSMTVILAIQALFFADGGLMALGANIWNMAFYGCFAGYYLIWRPVMRSRIGSMRAKIALASVVGCVLSLQLGAFSVCLETSLSGVTELPFGAFVALMQPIHLAIGLVEGLVTSAVLLFVHEARPELLGDVEGSGRLSYKGTLIVLGVVVAMIAGGMSLLASSNPDGLEWSLFGNAEAGYSENMGLDEENYGTTSAVADVAAKVQQKTAILPDYGFADGADGGTSVAGVAGAGMVALVALLIGALGGFFRKKRTRTDNI